MCCEGATPKASPDLWDLFCLWLVTHFQQRLCIPRLCNFFPKSFQQICLLAKVVSVAKL